MGELQRLSGRCTVLTAFDIGDFVTLPKASQFLVQASPQQAARTRRAPSDFGLDPQPLVWEAEPVQLILRQHPISVKRRAIVYDFGVVSASLTFDFDAPLQEWRNLSDELYEHAEFLDISKQTAEAMIEKILPAIDDPRFAKIHEGYFVFQFDPDPKQNLESWLAENRLLIAQTLRGENVELSSEETEESLGRRIAYGIHDLAIIDWNSAMIIDWNYEDTLAVLEFANGQLLEMRILDDRLDDLLEEAYRMIHRKPPIWKRLFPLTPSAVQGLAKLMADAASEFEAVNNAIKLTNDQYLARVYRIAAKRFHLTAFDSDISRKLDSLWEIQNVYTEGAFARRLEVLEWIVIILIAFEILKSF